MNLVGCEWKNISTTATDDVDGSAGSIVSRYEFFKNFDELEKFIHSNNSNGYVYLAYNLDNTDTYSIESYKVNVLAKLSSDSKVHYLMNSLTINGKISRNNVVGENQIVVSFATQKPHTYKDIIISEDTVLEIIALPNKVDELKVGYCMYYGVYIGDNELMEFSIKSISQKLSIEEFSELCDDLKQYLVIASVGGN